MTRRLPSLNALKAFESAARLESVTVAAAELNVSHAAVSRHIRDLEIWLGAKLFHRTGRGVTLTEEGRVLGRDLTPVFDALVAATNRFAKPARRRELVISSEIPFAALWLVSRLGRFTAKHPDIDLVIDPSNNLVDFSRNEADLGIRFGGGAWKDVDVTPIFESWSTPVASPALVKRLGIRSEKELDCGMLLREDTKKHWKPWLEEAGISGDVESSGPVLKGHLAISAAEAGQGFALADDIQAGDAILAGRLVMPFATRVRTQGYYLVRGSGVAETRAMAAFRHWLIDELALSAGELEKFRVRKRP